MSHRPKIDAFWEASQDVGAAASRSGDKSPFELETGVVAEVPLQRREAAGKVLQAQARLEQLRWQRQFVEQALAADLLNYATAMDNARMRQARAQDNLRLAQQTLEIGRRAFAAGDIDLLSLNLYEQAAADAERLLVDAAVDFFTADAEYRLAAGTSAIDPPTFDRAAASSDGDAAELPR